MTTSTFVPALSHVRSIGRSRVASAHVAGTLLFVAGGVFLLATITAEALYPAAYSTGRNEISDLGGTRPPAGLVFQPSATIFNVGMLVTGILIILGALVLGRGIKRWSVTIPLAILGAAVLLVGIFPGNTGTPHAIAAMVGFISGGVSAVLSARVSQPPFRYALQLLGAVNLVLLASYFIQGDSSPIWALGTGGAERWIVYPVILWLLGFGGYLAGQADGERRAEGEGPTAGQLRT